MVLKAADDISRDIAELKALVARPGLSKHQIARIEEQLWNAERGAWGEKEAAYYLDFYFRSNPYAILIHDLRLALSNGATAQIDHLIINRRLEVFVLESKNWNDLTVDEHGDCTVGKGRKGVPSPLEQCRRHAELLRRVFELDADLKAIAPRHKMICRVLLSPSCVLSVPNHREWYLKADAFHSAYREKDSMHDSLAAMTRLITQNKLTKMGEVLLAMHNPVQRDFAAWSGEPSPAHPPQIQNAVVAQLPEIADAVPRWGDDWFVLAMKPSGETKIALRAAGYRPSKEGSDWVWRLRR